MKEPKIKKDLNFSCINYSEGTVDTVVVTVDMVDMAGMVDTHTGDTVVTTVDTEDTHTVATDMVAKTTGTHGMANDSLSSYP